MKLGPKYHSPFVLRTNGRGLWSTEKRDVPITKIEIHSAVQNESLNGQKQELAGEMRVFFRKKDWSIKRLGFIYTDPKFLRELRSALKADGWRGTATVEYSEQGMQGYDYVSLDVGHMFLRQWFALSRII